VTAPGLFAGKGVSPDQSVIGLMSLDAASRQAREAQVVLVMQH